MLSIRQRFYIITECSSYVLKSDRLLAPAGAAYHEGEYHMLPAWCPGRGKEQGHRLKRLVPDDEVSEWGSAPEEA